MLSLRTFVGSLCLRNSAAVLSRTFSVLLHTCNDGRGGLRPPVAATRRHIPSSVPSRTCLIICLASRIGGRKILSLGIE
jgi:hypothetical protein